MTETDPEFWNKIYLGRFAGNRSRAGGGGERIFGTAPCLNSGVLTELHTAQLTELHTAQLTELNTAQLTGLHGTARC